MEKGKIDLKSLKNKVNNLKKENLEKSFKKALYSPYLYLILGIIFGLLFTVQFKTQSNRPLSPVLFYGQLQDVKTEFDQKKNALGNQVKTLQTEVRNKENDLVSKNLVSNSMLNDLSSQEMLFGSSNISGEGVVINLSDGEMQIKDEESKSLAHAADLRDIVNLLWYAGAEAISINDERLIYNTSIDCIVSTIMINNNNYAPPFTIKAIGNKNDLFNVINSSIKLVDIKKRADKKQIVFGIQMQGSIKINQYSGPYSK
jgi:uncharacterized protein YlxW (UPF0749 family)